jgi:hypothetical protein
MKKHDINLIAAWAKDWGIKGYDHLDPKAKEQNRQYAIKKNNENGRGKLNKTLTKQGR